jgi:hypothetical protein
VQRNSLFMDGGSGILSLRVIGIVSFECHRLDKEMVLILQMLINLETEHFVYGYMRQTETYILLHILAELIQEITGIYILLNHIEMI